MLKVGDRVRVIDKASAFYECKGTVTKIVSEIFVDIEIDLNQKARMSIKERDNPWCFHVDNLDPI